jgi:hypothetical protein
MIAYPSSSTKGSYDDMSKMLTSFMNGISKAFETNPGTSLDTVTSLSHAIAKARARDNVSSDVCNAEINSTSFCKFYSVHHCPVGPMFWPTITGTGLKKWSPDRRSFEYECTQRAFNSPTTRPALRLPSADAADSPCGTAEAAILVMEIDDVLVAKIVSGPVSAASSLNMRCLTSRFSETALDITFSELKQGSQFCPRTSMTISTSRSARTPTA